MTYDPETTANAILSKEALKAQLESMEKQLQTLKNQKLWEIDPEGYQWIKDNMGIDLKDQPS